MNFRAFPRVAALPAVGARCRGFTMTGLLLGLAAVGLAIAIGVSEFRKFRHRAARDRFVTDLKTIAAAFESYRAEKGEWPAGTSPEQRTPKGMEARLATTTWQAGPGFGGGFEWVPPQAPAPAMPPPPAPAAPRLPDPDAPAVFEAPAPASKQAAANASSAPAPLRPAMISVTGFSPAPPLALTEEDLRYLDEKLDDGNLATGRFRAGFNRWPVYLLNRRP